MDVAAVVDRLHLYLAEHIQIGREITENHRDTQNHAILDIFVLHYGVT